MAQYPPTVFAATNSAGRPAALRAEAAESAVLNISADSVLKTSAVRVGRVSVVVTGTADPGVYDCAATGAISSTCQVAAVPNTVGVYLIDWPCAVGLTVAAADAKLAVTLA